MEATRNSQQNLHFSDQHAGRTRLWVAARRVALLVTIVEIAALFVIPDIAIVALRDVIIPVVPAALLLNPLIWRNVCPLATANMLTRSVGKNIRPSHNGFHRMMALGMALFLILVPARRFLFNSEAAVLSATIIVLVLAAAVLGSIFDMKSGFCNSFCPILPVERLYGFSPMVGVSNHRCAPRCTGCAAACVDLSPQKSPRQALGNGKSGRRWVFTPFGMFVLAFPGFVLGYYSITDVPLDQALAVYSRILSYSAASLALLGALALAFRVSFDFALPFLAASAAGLYYWYSSPTFAGALGLGSVAGTVLRVATLSFVAIWLIGAIRRSTERIPQPRAA